MCACPVFPKPCAACDFGGCELYPGDVCYFVDGLTICEDCLIPFARRWLASFRRAVPPQSDNKEGFFCTP